MKVEVIAISSRSFETEPSVALVIDGTAYIFNTPNQIQRTVTECSFKALKTKHIFFTSLNNSSIGGFYGLFATYYQHFGPNVEITGPKGIDDIVNAYIDTFFTLENVNKPATQDFQDESLQVSHIDIGSSFCYSIKLPDTPGKFLPANAIARSIKPGKDFKLLSSGESVVNIKGETVYPHECCEPAIPGEKVLIVDCQNICDLENLTVDLFEYSMIIHFTKEDILLSEQYLARFPAGPQNLCFINDNRPVFTTVYGVYNSIALRSNNLVGPLYNQPRLWYPPIPYTQVNIGNVFKLVPVNKKGFEDYFIDSRPKPKTFRITFTGTAGNNPTKLRGVSGILFESIYGNIILDCGEGFVGQITRKYGPVTADEILRNVKLIWISHHHGDHTYGIHELLEKLKSLGNMNVILSCHSIVLNLVNAINKHTDSMSFTYVEQNDQISIDNLILESVDVVHVDGSKGCKISADDWIVAYSGDRKATPGFVEAVGCCNVLIHEATYEDDLENEAADRCHSTTGQAIQTGIDLKADYIVLTHYSQRYTTPPKYRDDVKNVITVFDYLSFEYEKMDELVLFTQNNNK